MTRKEYVWQLPVYDEHLYGEDHHISGNMKAHCFINSNYSSSLCGRHIGAFNPNIEIISEEVIENNAYDRFGGVCKKCYELLQKDEFKYLALEQKFQKEVANED